MGVDYRAYSVIGVRLEPEQFVMCQKEKCMAWSAVKGTIKEPVYGCKLINREV